MKKQLWAVGVREYYPACYRIRVERMRDGVENPFDMAGTEGTHGYTVHTTVEAEEGEISKALTRVAGWKQPGDGGQDRFSITCSGEATREMKLGLALKAVGVHKASSARKVNPDVASVAEKLGVKAHGWTAKATIAAKLIRLAKVAPVTK